MEAIFIKALNMSISAGWLILAVMVLRLLLKKAPKWISVVLWGLVGLRLVFPFSLQSVFSLIPSAEVVSPSIGYAQHPEINSGVSVIDNAVNPTLGTSLAATPMNSVNPMQIVLYLGGLVWVGGIAILLLYGLISYLRLRRKVAEAIPYEKNTWLCDQVKTPFILGVLRPRIYLPSGLNEEETAYVLAHEYAHLKRKDHLWKPLGFLLLTVYWFNPLVWVAYILLCRDIEAACDEKVISDMGMTEKKAYANALVSCSMQRRLILACPLAFGEVGVKERVKGVLNYRKPAFWIIVTALIACVVIAVCFLTNPKDDEPDLSFLNYKNAISLIGQNGNGVAPSARLYPADSDGVQPGVADAEALAQFLESAEWTQRRAPSSSPEPRGYLEFIIDDDYRIIVYQSERLAAVRYGNEIRYYRTNAGDYEAALATFIPAPSTEPDWVPEQTAKPGQEATTGVVSSTPHELTAEDSFMSLDGTVEYFFPSDSSFAVTNLPAVEVAPHEITAEEAARLADALFPGAAYSGYVFDAPRTKADLQASMGRWRGYLTDGTLRDLFCEDEDILADMEKVIGRWEEGFAEKLAAAPEKETRIPAQWAFRPDSEVWAGGNPGTETIRVLVDCGEVEYSFCAANRTQDDFSVHMIYGSLENKSSPNNIDTLLQQYELCRSSRPTEAQLTVIMEKAQSALTALNVGEWKIDLCLVERLPRGLEEAYIVTVKAVPVFQGNAAVRFAQLENMRNNTEGAQHYYYSDASFSFAPNGTLLDFSVYSLVDVVDVRNSGETLSGDELLKVAKDRFAERGLAFYNGSYPTDLGVSAKVYIDRMTYGLVRIEIENGITYRYLPALCIDGHVELYDEYGKIFYESTTDGLTRMLVLNAVDGTDIVFSS